MKQRSPLNARSNRKRHIKCGYEKIDKFAALSCAKKFTFSQGLDYNENIPTVMKSMTCHIQVCQVFQKLPCNAWRNRDVSGRGVPSQR